MLNWPSLVKRSLNKLKTTKTKDLVDPVDEAVVVVEEALTTTTTTTKALTHQLLKTKALLERLPLDLLVKIEVLVNKLKHNKVKKEKMLLKTVNLSQEAVVVVAVEAVDVVVVAVAEVEEVITTLTDLLALNQLNQPPHCLLLTYRSTWTMPN
jgi:hypothetical protein